MTEVKSVWLRRRSVPDIQIQPTHHRSYIEQEWVKFFRNLWITLKSSRWVNNPLSLELASNKLHQLQLAVSTGFNVPQTVFTNSLTSVSKLQEESTSGRCIYKPHDSGAVNHAGGEAVYTNILSEYFWQSEQANERLQLCPGIFQTYIAKAFELRVTVVGNLCFAAKIDSQASSKTRVDWRRYDFANVNHEAFALPKDIQQKCIQLISSMDLVFGAIDMIVTPDGEYYFLEVNANGQWAWIQLLTGQDIASAIADTLC